MKVGRKLIVVLKDTFGTAFSEALQPNNSNLIKIEECFELSLERYGIKDCKASGVLFHLSDQVTLLLLENYEPPVLACAVSEVLASVIKENLSALPTLVFPVIVSASKLKLEKKYLAISDRDHPLYGVQIGPESDTTRALLSKCEQPPASLQIYHESVACFLQLARVSKLSTCVLVGLSGQRQSQNSTGNELEAMHVIGELLASVSSLCFSKEKIKWNPSETLKDVKEPWRALYG